MKIIINENYEKLENELNGIYQLINLKNRPALGIIESARDGLKNLKEDYPEIFQDIKTIFRDNLSSICDHASLHPEEYNPDFLFYLGIIYTIFD